MLSTATRQCVEQRAQVAGLLAQRAVRSPAGQHRLAQPSRCCAAQLAEGLVDQRLRRSCACAAPPEKPAARTALTR